MKRNVVFIFLALSVLVSASYGQKLSDVAGLAGCWERRDEAKKLLISEQWMSPAGSSILGMGRTVRDGKTTDWEFMRIEERADGLYFVARPRGNADDTSFKLVDSEANNFIFENKAHDFPQRVMYKISGDALTGRIEGVNNGKAMGIDFPMRRVKCG
jgi:hypothetical protein